MAQLINAQLIQAHAGGRAPLVQAHAGGVGLRIPGTAPLRGISAAQTAAPALRGTLAAPSGPSSRAQPRVVSRTASVAPVSESDYKVTGTSIFNRPDEESQWDPGNGGRWIRPWLPGEKEAEATRRVGEVQNDLAEERELTAQGRRERAALVEDVVNSIKAGKFSREELPALMEQFSGAEDMIKMADALREREPTAEEAFRKSTFTDQNGIVFGRDGKVLYNPNDARMKQAEYDAKRLDALKTRADKFELELRKPYKVTVGEGDDAIDQMQMRDDAEIERLMQRRFPELYPSPTSPSPTSEPAAEDIVEDVDSRKKKWGGFAD